MRAPSYTTQPFTAAVCTACGGESGAVTSNTALMSTVRDVVRNCPHGVLIAAECLLGRLACAGSRKPHGAMLFLQPCAVDRRPVTPALLVGPVETDADAETVCRWVASGVWDPALLPPHLHTPRTLARHSRLN